MAEKPLKIESIPDTMLFRVLASPSTRRPKNPFFPSAIRLILLFIYGQKNYSVRLSSIKFTLTRADTPFSCMVMP